MRHDQRIPCSENRKRLIPHPDNSRPRFTLEWSAVSPDGDVTYNEGMSLVDVPLSAVATTGRRIVLSAS